MACSRGEGGDYACSLLTEITYSSESESIDALDLEDVELCLLFPCHNSSAVS